MSQNNLIENVLKPLDGHLISIVRDTMNGWYEIKFGIPASWVYDESNDDIACVVESSTDKGILLKVHPKKEGVVIDELFKYLNNLMNVNQIIKEKENEFLEKMKEHKTVIEQEKDKFDEEIDDLKLNAFKSKSNENSEDETKNESSSSTKEVKTTTTKKTGTRGRKPKTTK